MSITKLGKYFILFTYVVSSNTSLVRVKTADVTLKKLHLVVALLWQINTLFIPWSV
jgi:hypothetical protein